MELIAAGDLLNIGRIAINNWYSGTTNLWTAGTGSGSVKLSANTVSGTFGLSAGKSNTVSVGAYGTVLNGSGNTLSNSFGTIINGKNNAASGAYSCVGGGRQHTSSGQKSFIGNGSSNLASGSYGFIGNGNTNKSTSTFSAVVNGTMCYSTNTSAFIGSGNYNTASGAYSSILNGILNIASGAKSLIGGGRQNTASGTYSSVINGFGNTASASYSMAVGKSCNASHSHGIAIGNGAATDGTNQIVFAPSSAGNTIKLDYGSGNGYFDGGADVGNADYAEYFEWEDGNPKEEKRYGYAVSLSDNSKIKIGNEHIIGIVSSTPGIIGNSSEMSWDKKYITNEWGIKEILNVKSFFSTELNKKIYVDDDDNFYSDIPTKESEKNTLRIHENISIPENTQFEIISVAKIQESYNKEEKYTPRSERPEWTVVGLLGQLRIRTAENITSKFIDINNKGMAINGTKYRVLRTIKEYDSNYGIVLIFFK